MCDSPLFSLILSEILSEPPYPSGFLTKVLETTMPTPQSGDILIRNTPTGGFELVDAVSYALIDGPFSVAFTAIAEARQRVPRAIWHQQVDERGRTLGDPVRLPEQ